MVLAATLLTSAMALVQSPVYAQEGGAADTAGAASACGTAKGAEFLKFPTWYKFLDSEQVGGKCTPKFVFPDDIPKILMAIFEIILRVAGIVAVVMVVYGGIQYTLSQGEPDRVKGARRTIVNALVGLVITMSATAMVNFVARGIT